MNKKYDIDYSRLPHYIFIVVVVVALAVLNYFYFSDHISSNSELVNNFSLRDDDMNKTRQPAVAGLFYPADSYQLSAAVDGYLAASQPVLSSRPHILVVPHAGYVYSAAVAAKAYQRLLPFRSEIKKVILVGPSHRVALQGAALSSAAQFKTPLGLIETDSGITAELSALPDFRLNDRAHAAEHSLEVQLPFLQKVLEDFTIVPIAYGDISPRSLAAALQPYLRRNDVLIVISADLSHYLDYDSAKTADAATADAVDRKQALESHQSCGATGINAALELARRFNLKPRLLDMANSGDITGNNDRVVGYASWMFDNDEPAPQLSPLEQELENLNYFAKYNGEALIGIARHSLKQTVEGQRFRPARKNYADVLFNKGASFVTLTKNGALRGCIGTLVPSQAVARDVAANAYAAALEDRRFSPLTAAELPEVRVSVSLLTGYERLKFDSEQDLLRQLQPGIDGLVIRDGDRQGLFLPSVWQQLPAKTEFLNNLKLKAGLSPAYWSDQIKAYRFRTVEIKENEI